MTKPSRSPILAKHRNLTNCLAPATGAIVTLLAITALVATAPDAQSASAPPTSLAGSWYTENAGSIMEIGPCRATAGRFCGRLKWLKQANDGQGRPRLDINNPDPRRRSRPLLGTEIMLDFRQSSPGMWTDGKLYNPDDGRTYSGSIRVQGDELKLRGCALSIFCKTQVWRRVR
jgi:uncharacterized protein (DUF2147 family)